MGHAYADLAAVVAAWPALPDPIRRAVLAIVQTATPCPTGGTLRQLDDSAPAGYEPRPPQPLPHRGEGCP